MANRGAPARLLRSNAMIHFLIALLFWLVYEAMSWPLRLALTPLPMSGDLRRMISRLAGPVLIALSAWAAAHAGVPLGFAAAWIWFLIFAVSAWTLCRAQGVQPRLLQVISPISNPKAWRREAFIELFGLSIFLGYVAFRRWAPEMTFMIENSAAEKFANAMFFWSCWHAKTMPPEDYWLSGNPQVYYYWGHYFWAWIGRAGGFPGEWVITLALARLVALVWESGYLLARGFGARPFSACLGAFFITWAGNPQAVITAKNLYQYASRRAFEPDAQRESIFAPRYLKMAITNRNDLRNYQYWEASRVIPNTVNEFPAWSAILGDFHAHHLSIPWMIGFLALVLAGDRWFGLRRRGPPSDREKKGAPPHAKRSSAIAAGLWAACFFGLGVAASIANLWIAPLVGLASLMIFGWRLRRGRAGWVMRAGAIAALGLLMLVGAWLTRGSLDSPLPPAQGPTRWFAKIPVRMLPGDVRSSFGELLRLWGFQIGLLALAAGLAACRPRRLRVTLVALGFILVIIVLKLTLFPSESGLIWLALAVAAGSMGWGSKPWMRREAAALIALACLLLAGLEFFYIPDRFGTGVNLRYNTYFKLSYPVWPVLTAGAWIGVVHPWRWRRWRPLRYALRGGLVLLFPFVMALVIFGMPARNMQASIGDARPRRPTLDAFAWLANRPGYEAEAELLHWIRNNVPPRDRVAEWAGAAAGYSYQGRVASLGGRPIPLGWNTHEFQWRGDAAGPLVQKNINLTRRIYRALDEAALLAAARELGVRWVVMGKNEREELKAARFGQTLAVLGRAGRLRARFPRVGPRVFLFELPRVEDQTERAGRD